MFGKKLKKDYVSEFEQFFRAFDEKRSDFPLSRKQEVEKHKKIAQKRDHAVEDEKPVIWEKF